ncbi:hypothetical protein ASPWEDRAFT_172612 [Aspergillus wentii DTO 134E9]|uniref:Uncharacterized protein n=1 Tax=Aspergillus wentii DTO 134E9 TaxID=1073089 RepID=A0A1L9RLV7_ASPWE|nr:uncharacterized protein ASPWEDRAFT_172612 [Aspergillus wentii DTO 134E9]KAI9929725.1 hypothetical protein MW887_001201 [Aspergillus wentii]OJJ35817.1 hypothetical protein ASPWEDRAFT_172612 [Aspergillus wentii DTO 134E9]
MRLIHNTTLTVVKFTPDRVPPHAILSQAWGEGEILLSDIEKGTAQTKAAWGVYFKLSIASHLQTNNMRLQILPFVTIFSTFASTNPTETAGIHG